MTTIKLLNTNHVKALFNLDPSKKTWPTNRNRYHSEKSSGSLQQLNSAEEAEHLIVPLNPAEKRQHNVSQVVKFKYDREIPHALKLIRNQGTIWQKY